MKNIFEVEVMKLNGEFFFPTNNVLFPTHKKAMKYIKEILTKEEGNDSKAYKISMHNNFIDVKTKKERIRLVLNKK